MDGFEFGVKGASAGAKSHTYRVSKWSIHLLRALLFNVCVWNSMKALSKTEHFSNEGFRSRLSFGDI